MTTTTTQLIAPKQIAGSQETQYTATNVTAKIGKFTVTNTSTSPVQFSCNLVSSGGTPGNDNLIIDARTISPDETYSCPEIVSHTILNGDYISTLSSAAASLTIMASGIEIA